ncbi:hypothetical protein BDQ12DRAFT_687863 [Crucibulum laeve]|uniref:Uncharacterized protein n=1 Tax=Crucibulum laeve TaxID=68775 RepID=A0A5C3LRE8_9AGAR|nr:hypothetical protein BDQ12DRAFT_687863 [Crucibulum laeve]
MASKSRGSGHVANSLRSLVVGVFSTALVTHQDEVQSLLGSEMIVCYSKLTEGEQCYHYSLGHAIMCWLYGQWSELNKVKTVLNHKKVHTSFQG